jgi:phosphatidylserine decarboxylase
MRLAPGAWRRALVPAAAGVLLAFVHPFAGIAALLLAAGVLAFFRDPERSPPAEGVVAPADGRVSVVRAEEPPTDADDTARRQRVGVFMNVTDVHVNRAPLAGTVSDVTHEPGAHRPAFSKESDRNEKLRIRVETGGGDEYEVILIAGWFARRIRPYVEPGDELARGQRIGHVAFGSRADVVFPPGVDREDLRVGTGEGVRAGETVVADGP